MRNLVLLIGPPGSGKSTFLAENGFEPYTLSSDSIRLMHRSPVLTMDGRLSISQNVNKVTFELMFELLETKMEYGEFIVIDATHCGKSAFKGYKKLSEKYRYRVWGIDFSKTPKDVAKKRNKSREAYKFVPEHVIDEMYGRIDSAKIPSWIKVITPEEVEETFKYHLHDLSYYSKIHHIGDIHGCLDPLEKYFKEGLNSDEMYIFVGDYIDRGLQNAEVLEFLMSVADEPNVLLLEGNHEIHLWNWANNLPIRSRKFIQDTAPQLEEEGIDKSAIRQFYRKLSQAYAYTYGDKKVLVSHGGLSTFPENLIKVPTRQLIKGVGTYDDIPYSVFDETTDEDTYQIHGHRNTRDYPTQAGKRSFNLEGKVEFGGFLRSVVLHKEGFSVRNTKNGVFKAIEGKDEGSEHSNDPMILELRNHSLVDEKSLPGDISSFNFSRDAFYKQEWSTSTIKARGLFVNIRTTEIVSRSYDKFFNVGQMPDTELTDLADSFAYPVRMYNKENGYLGIVGVDSEKDGLLYFSKTTSESTFAREFKDLFEKKVSEKDRNWLETFLKDKNLTLVCEVVIPDFDPHIIEYTGPLIVVLDLVKRTMFYEKLPHNEVEHIATKKLKLPSKTLYKMVTSKEDLSETFKEIEEKGTSLFVEGFVLEDSSGFMVKYKTEYYTIWKAARSLVEALNRGSDIENHRAFNYGVVREFYKWLKNMPEEYSQKDIITLRSLWERTKK